MLNLINTCSLIHSLATNSYLCLVCSGLAIVSRFPIQEYEFNSYTWHGDPKKAFIDGEWLARKGVGRIRIEPLPNVTVSVVNHYHLKKYIL